jgi:hypothetical protein
VGEDSLVELLKAPAMVEVAKVGELVTKGVD